MRAARVVPPGFRPPRQRLGSGAQSRRVPFNRIQVRAAAGLLASKHTAAHAYAIAAADYTHLDAVRTSANLTSLPFVARAVVLALSEFPDLNATVHDGEIEQMPAVGLGIAVDLAHQGLVVPVVRDAHARSIRDLASAITDVAARARAKRLQPDDVAGGTFTITNPGGYGTYWSFPIINQPQVAILSTDGVAKRAVADADGALVIRRIGYLGLGYDARAVRSDRAAGFVTRIAELLATTDWFAEL